MAEWIRISYFLPVTTRNDRTAYLRTLESLRTRYPLISGFTYSQDAPPTYRGYYWSDALQLWVQDYIAVIFIDRPSTLQERATVRQEAQTLKSQIARFYEEEGSPQESVWCTIQPIELV
ncbi:MAG: hypothetical protein HYZ81_05480 [Nitrospinae bacterium]|nr:hypothetical protein [Nitrospinota bacterium]